MKMRILSALAVVAIMLAAVLAPAMGALSLMNNSNESLNESGTPAPTSIPTPSPTLTPPILNLNLSENVRIIGNDSFSAHETPEFVIEIEQAFIDAIANVGDKPVQVQIHVEGGEGSRLELFVEEIATNNYRVTIPNHKTGEFKPGIYTLVVEVNEQSVEHPFKWGLEPEAEPEEPLIPPLNLSEHMKIIGNDSFSASETPEFVIEIEQAFIDAVSDADSDKPVKIQISVEGCEGNKDKNKNRVEVFVEEIAPNKFKVTISKPETEELTSGIYTLVVAVGEQSVEHAFEWGVEPEPTYVEPQPQNLTVNVTAKPVLTAKKKHFAINEKPTFTFEYTAEAEVKSETEETLISNISSLKPKSKSKPEPKLKQTKKWTSGTVNVSIETFVYDYEGELTDIEPEIEKVGEGEFNIEIPSQRAFRAGLYKLKVELVKDRSLYLRQSCIVKFIKIVL
ncbi:MAG TPA: hypothetical protein C5S37_05880, partial [Methanophagales archaeon]|nr:hypothetical protein [Methanophagales archaeon]